MGRIIQGHVLTALKQLPDNYIHQIITSPPYYNLRSYADLQEVVWPDGTMHPFGSEPTVQLYIDHTVAILRELRRVLRPEGVLYYNIDDSNAGSGGGHKPHHKNDNSFQHANEDREMLKGVNPTKAQKDIPAKNLCLIPQRIAIAAQEDGWYVRSFIIWAKGVSGQKELSDSVFAAAFEETGDIDLSCTIAGKFDPFVGNVMPESVKDRPTQSHEYILMLTKEPKCFYDYYAAQEDAKCNGGKRNMRDTWILPTKGFRGAHTAAFPEELVRKCMVSSPQYVCKKCGKGWQRQMTKVGEFLRRWSENNKEGSPYNKQGSTQNIYEDLGLFPDCRCYETGKEEVSKAIILDPFLGSGTTAIAAEHMHRDWVGIELSSSYIEVAKKRIQDETGVTIE